MPALEPSRYAVLNPVRAGMAGDVGGWPWSSFPGMIGTVPKPDRLQMDGIPGQFSPQRDRARIGYLDFVRAGVGLSGVWDLLKGQIYLGGEAFIERMQSNLSPDQALDEIASASSQAVVAVSG